jgi:hypothetical protein
MIISVLSHFKVITGTLTYSQDEVSKGLSDFLVCLEMAVAAIAHNRYLSFKGFYDPSKTLHTFGTAARQLFPSEVGLSGVGGWVDCASVQGRGLSCQAVAAALSALPPPVFSLSRAHPCVNTTRGVPLVTPLHPSLSLSLSLHSLSLPMYILSICCPRGQLAFNYVLCFAAQLTRDVKRLVRAPSDRVALHSEPGTVALSPLVDADVMEVVTVPSSGPGYQPPTAPEVAATVASENPLQAAGARQGATPAAAAPSGGVL